MLRRRMPMYLRFVVFLVASASSLAVGMIISKSPSEAVHFAVLPGFAAYVLLFRPDFPSKVKAYHLVYLTLLVAVVAGYMIALTTVTPQMSVRWSELGVAIYFLLALHIVVWLIDRLVNMVLSAIFFIHRSARRPLWKYIPKTILRVVIVIAIAVPYLTATFMTHWVKFADATDPYRSLEMYYETAHFRAIDGLRLEGWFITSVDESDATVILVPGRGLTKACYLDYVRLLADNGYNVLLFDMRGEGGSDGHTRSFGVHEANDVLGALRYLRQVHPQQSRYIFGYGISHGAAAVVSAAGADKRIKAVVIDSPFAEPTVVLDSAIRIIPSPLRQYIRWASMIIASAELGCNLFQAGNIREIGRISPRPVLILHGLDDKISPPTDAERLYHAAGSPKRLCEIPNAGHAQNIYLGGDEYAAEVLAVFKAVRQNRPVFRW